VIGSISHFRVGNFTGELWSV
jgi:Vacuolar protein sorting-associated protein 62